MQPEADPSGPQRKQLHATLLEYARSPGKYQVAARQPPLLFAMLRDVLQIAAGRDTEAIGDEGQAAQLRHAACFFARTALLYPGADYYALLGLSRSAEAGDIKDRYRVLMRLLHPDFASPDSNAWPSDAATRINRAYEVLSSATQRREYDELFAPPAAAALAGKPQARRNSPLPRAKKLGLARSHFKVAVAACALLGVAAVAISFLGSGSEPAQLVQRTSPAVTASQSVNVAVQNVAINLPVPLAAPTGGPSFPGTAEPSQSEAPHTAPLTLSMTAELTAPPPDQRPSAKGSATVPGRPGQLPAARPAIAPMTSSTQGGIGNGRTQREPAAPFIQGAQAAPLPPQRNTWVEPTPPPEEKVETPVAAAPLPPPAASVPRLAAARAGLTLVEAQPLLSQLLQQMESGRGDRLLGLLDAEARGKPAAQAFSRQFDSLVDGARPVRLSHVEFKAEPGDGRLYVVGHLRLLAGDQTIGAMGKKMSLRAEFASRQGTVVLTGLSTAPGN